MLFECLILIVAIFILYKTIRIYVFIKKYENIPGPSANGLFGFYLGNLPAIIQADRHNISTVEYFAKIIEMYGPTCKFRSLDRILILTTDPELVKKVLIEENYPKHPILCSKLGFPFGIRCLGYGLVSESNVQKWKARRTFLNPGFHRHSIISFMREFNTEGNTLINNLRTYADTKQPVKLLDQFNIVTLCIISSVAFSMNIENENLTKLSEYVELLLYGVEKTLRNPYFQYNPFNWRFLKKYKESVYSLRKLGRDQINQRLEAMRNDEHIPNDILTTILDANANKNEDIHVEDMVDDFVTFFLAGAHTTATTLAYIFRELCRNGDVLHKLRKEIDGVIGSKINLKYEDLSELKYTNAIIKEALRLYPPVTQIIRWNTEDIQHNGYTIPKGSWIMLHNYSSSRSEQYFPEPLSFRPERFIKDDSPSSISNTYHTYPFSLGSRSCIGQTFAQIEIKVIMVKMIQNFDFQLDPSEEFTELFRGLLKPKDGTKCHLKFRSSI